MSDSVRLSQSDNIQATIQEVRDQCYNWDREQCQRDEWYKNSIKDFNDVPLVLKWTVRDISRGNSTIMVICGRQGLGKSNTGVKLADWLHNKIGVMHGNWIKDKQVAEDMGMEQPINLVYNVDNFLQRMKEAVRQVIIFDESGVNISSKNWQSHFNQAVRSVLDTQRVKENVYVFILPKFSDIDKSIREQADWKLEMQQGYICKQQLRMTDYSAEQLNESVSTEDFGYWNVDPAPDTLWDLYKEKELWFKQDVLDSELQEIRDKRGDGSGSDEPDSLLEL